MVPPLPSSVPPLMLMFVALSAPVPETLVVPAVWVYDVAAASVPPLWTFTLPPFIAYVPVFSCPATLVVPVVCV
jgi:hypothetical protein